MISWFARNDIAANLLMAMIIFSGLYSLFFVMKFEIFPDVEPDTILVSVALRGATPEDIELGITIRIEEAVQDLEGIDEITSHSAEGSAAVRIETDSGYDTQTLLSEIKNRVDAINTFPADTEKPVISLKQNIKEVISVVVSGELSEQEIRIYTEQIRDELLRIDGITQAKLDAVRKYEINIEISQDQLRNYNLTLADIASSIRNSSLDLSAGNVRTKGGDILIRSKGQAYRRDAFESIVVKVNVDGSIIRLSDLATVKDGFEEVSLKTTFNGDLAALIQVYRLGNQSALDISQKVRDYIDQQQHNLPQGIQLAYWDDDAAYLKARLNTLTDNALQGGVLVIILLTLFLRRAVAFWVFIGIPISFLGSMILLPYLGQSINAMSLYGFIIVLGIVVDDAIVTGENVYKRMTQGEDSLEASIKGTQEVATPVTFGILTTIAAFLPLAFIEGRIGDFMAPIPIVVISCLLFSLLESKLVLPSHLKRININSNNKTPNKFSRWQEKTSSSIEHAIILYYRPTLQFCIRNRYEVAASFIGIFILTIALIVSGWISYAFFPAVESDTGRVTLTMPIGTPFDVTDRHMRRITEAAIFLQQKYVDGDTNHPLITNILSTTGSARGKSGADNIGQIIIETIPSDQRITDFTTTQLIQEWRQIVGAIPGAESVIFRAEMFRAGDPIHVQISSDSLKLLSSATEKIKQHLTTYQSIFDISDSLSDGKEELHIELTTQGHILGLTRADVVGQISQAFKGFQVQRIQRGRDDIRVIVRLPKRERNHISTLNEYLISTPNGGRVPLSHIATLTADKGPSTITRIDRYRTVNITADLDQNKNNMAAIQADLIQYLNQLTQQYPGLIYSMEGQERQRKESFASMKMGLILLIFAIYSLLALPLKSYMQPFIVMSTIPFALIGAVAGHWLMGRDLSFLSTLGLMALIGIVINDSLVLMDFINKQKLKGIGVYDAVINAGVARFRPVILTSLTTFFGLLPIIFAKSVQSQFLIPMSISMGFGILFATMVTLLMLPINILIIEDIRCWWNKNLACSDATIIQQPKD